MSKSLGNVVAPQEVTDKLGAEILRLWAASTDYSGELTISKEILDRVVEVYRRLRNTLRFLLANTADFDAQTQMLPVGEWLEIDRYALALTLDLQGNCLAAYDRYEFHKVVQALQNFCAEDLGAFYLDILKDRLYTTDGADPQLYRRGNHGGAGQGQRDADHLAQLAGTGRKVGAGGTVERDPCSTCRCAQEDRGSAQRRWHRLFIAGGGGNSCGRREL
jgi:hypothetical protein